MKTILACLLLMSFTLQGKAQEKSCSCTSKVAAKNTSKINTSARYIKGYVNPNHQIALDNAQPLFDKIDGNAQSSPLPAGTCKIRTQNQVVVTECTGNAKPPVPVFTEMEDSWLLNNDGTYTGQYPLGTGVAPQNGNDAYHRK